MKKIMFNDRYSLTQAVIDGSKTATRRIMYNQSGNLTEYIWFTKKKCDLLYVKADFDNGISEVAPYAIDEIVALAQSYNEIYDTDVIRELEDGFVKLSDCADWTNKMFVSSELMPHQIRITGIRPERLQDISDEDCMREGIRDVTYFKVENRPYELFALPGHKDEETFNTPRQAFAAMIDKVSGRGTWEKNPYVWVYEFELVK